MRAPTDFRCYPRAQLPGRPVPHMLRMSACQVGDPVPVLVLVEADNLLLRHPRHHSAADAGARPSTARLSAMVNPATGVYTSPSSARSNRPIFAVHRCFHGTTTVGMRVAYERLYDASGLPLTGRFAARFDPRRTGMGRTVPENYESSRRSSSARAQSHSSARQPAHEEA